MIEVGLAANIPESLRKSNTSCLYETRIPSDDHAISRPR